MATRKAGTIWSQTFALLCLTQMLGYAHNALLTPTIPLYVTDLGGSAFVVGLVLAAFAVASVLVRPLTGYWADTSSEASVLAIGCFTMGASLLPFYLPVLETILLANGMRGIGWAALNTGGLALFASIAPEQRRGEASGYFSAVQGSVSILFPAAALWLIDAPLGGFRVVIALSGAAAIAGGILALVLGRSAPTAAGDRSCGIRKDVPLNPFSLVERQVLLASVLLLCFNVTQPAATGFLVLHARAVGIDDVAWYFVISGSASLLARPVLGRIADKVGVGPPLAAGFFLEVSGLLLLGVASGLSLLLVAGVLYALGTAIGSATTLALAVQRTNPLRRGRAMASFSVAYPLSAGLGSLLLGGAADIAGYFWMYLLAGAMGALGLLIALTNWSRLKAY